MTLVLGTLDLSGVARGVLWVACGLYLLAVQGPTIRFNIPLNNAVQALEIESLEDAEAAEARARFEVPWNRWNRFRSLAASLSVVGLLILQQLLRSPSETPGTAHAHTLNRKCITSPSWTT